MYFFFNDTATTEIYTLSLHDALPISGRRTGRRRRGCRKRGTSGSRRRRRCCRRRAAACRPRAPRRRGQPPSERGSRSRSEEHTSELQSRQYLVCRLLLEKKKPITQSI